MVGKTLSLCITNHNRDRMLIESFHQVLKDDRVSEIIIVDDYSEDRFYNKVKDLTKGMDKVKLFRNRKNLGCYKNKREAIAQAQNEFVIIFDSDNVMTTGYIDKIFEQEWDKDVILAPDYVHSFDYRHFSGHTISKATVSNYTRQPRFDCLINTMNYFVHRDNYLKVWDGSIEPWTADTIYQNFRWLESGRTIHVLKGLEYDHRIKHEVRQEGSHYMQHNRKTGNLFNTIMDKLKRMK
jgi:glycosyltransferase involved in cell wall biosynthesis